MKNVRRRVTAKLNASALELDQKKKAALVKQKTRTTPVPTKHGRPKPCLFSIFFSPVFRYAQDFKNESSLTASDSSGYIYDKDGIDEEKWEWLRQLKEVRRGRIKEYADHFGCEFHAGRPWGVNCDLAFPCATQNEVDENDAKTLIANKTLAVAEGANMPCSNEALGQFVSNRMMYAPAKASNAGGVWVSGLEQSQNALRIAWSREEVDQKLQDIMSRHSRKVCQVRYERRWLHQLCRRSQHCWLR